MNARNVLKVRGPVIHAANLHDFVCFKMNFVSSLNFQQTQGIELRF